jgi:hypothetical protein
MSGGTISSNIANQSANGQGGGVFVISATFTKSGGIIYGDNDHIFTNNALNTPESNTALNSGNAVYVANTPTLKRDATAGTDVTFDTNTGSPGTDPWE